MDLLVLSVVLLQIYSILHLKHVLLALNFINSTLPLINAK